MAEFATSGCLSTATYDEDDDGDNDDGCDVVEGGWNASMEK
jgi:hypothetical protein